ncbi:TfoX/Sxy family protein [Pseudomarimonas salicorniae]|uniref:TfoX/Sxy family protein n=1 Tax=Pseudomarimonas salicorniae TaxID=2933270 RepID=A0ABT0GHQ1_9GAMM|nr:TfoX/Sxy family protein [Lysobacter sp. CAU 1642]MCK7593562.1 TfoX/Sxy family protein [Lysobacter sp. CAU 1642]
MIDWYRELLETIGPVSARKMFGGWGLFHDGRMFALVADEVLYLKVDAQTREAFAAAGSAPFVYESARGRAEMGYWRAPDEAMDDPEAMRPWARLAWQAAERQPQSRKRRVRGS